MDGSVSETYTGRKAALSAPCARQVAPLQVRDFQSRRADCFPNKKRPHFWGRISRGQNLVGDSGKAMQVAVPQNGPALREWVTRDESEGHVSGLRPLSTWGRCTCRAKAITHLAPTALVCNYLIGQVLTTLPWKIIRSVIETTRTNKCRTLHIHCMPMSRSGSPCRNFSSA
jgi:hypothetical protein